MKPQSNGNISVPGPIAGAGIPFLIFAAGTGVFLRRKARTREI